MNVAPTKKRKAEPKRIERLLGRYSQEKSGPTVVCICSIHGNEPSGMIAFKRVFEQLKLLAPEFHGELYGLAGNLKAIEQNERFIDYDLNRIWTKENIDNVRSGFSASLLHEKKELHELYYALQGIFKRTSGEIVVLDLHTTSSKSTPFISINDTIRNRDFALNFHLPAILGIEEFLEGTILNHINELGYIAIGFEGGQHEDPASIIVHESAIWTALFSCKNLEGMAERQQYHLERLQKHSSHHRKIFDVQHRHAVEESDHFKMFPGFVNLQPVKKHQLLATDNNGDIRAPKTASIFMPLYQKLGNDGFFIVRRISYFWLWFSKVLRTRDFHLLLKHLPGITAPNGNHNIVMVNKHIAKWKVIDFFHLLGFRRKSIWKDKIIFEKRKYDTQEP